MMKAKVVTTFGIENQWEQHMKNIDLDGDGTVDYEEWITATIDKESVMT